MYRDKTTLALIPARGGSKGLPHKNLLPLAGKPLIAWTVEAALVSAHVDRVVVTTDDAEMAETARTAGADVPFLRPAELATDTSPSIDAVQHALDWLRDNEGQTFDYLALLEPTSPLRAQGDIDGAIALLAENDARADGVVSIGEVHVEHPSIVKRIGDDGYLAPYLDEAPGITRRQDLGPAYFPYGVIYLVKVPELIATRSFYQDRTLPLLIERWQNYEIDDLYDLLCVEAVMNHRFKEGAR
jgi:CMP-N,N'-diacetyllegionaminic acid synthase